MCIIPPGASIMPPTAKRPHNGKALLGITDLWLVEGRVRYTVLADVLVRIAVVIHGQPLRADELRPMHHVADTRAGRRVRNVYREPRLVEVRVILPVAVAAGRGVGEGA